MSTSEDIPLFESTSNNNVDQETGTTMISTSSDAAPPQEEQPLFDAHQQNENNNTDNNNNSQGLAPSDDDDDDEKKPFEFDLSKQEQQEQEQQGNNGDDDEDENQDDAAENGEHFSDDDESDDDDDDDDKSSDDDDDLLGGSQNNDASEHAAVAAEHNSINSKDEKNNNDDQPAENQHQSTADEEIGFFLTESQLLVYGVVLLELLEQYDTAKRVSYPSMVLKDKIHSRLPGLTEVHKILRSLNAQGLVIQLKEICTKTSLFGTGNANFSVPMKKSGPIGPEIMSEFTVNPWNFGCVREIFFSNNNNNNDSTDGASSSSSSLPPQLQQHHQLRPEFLSFLQEQTTKKSPRFASLETVQHFLTLLQQATDPEANNNRLQDHNKNLLESAEWPNSQQEFMTDIRRVIFCDATLPLECLKQCLRDRGWKNEQVVENLLQYTKSAGNNIFVFERQQPSGKDQSEQQDSASPPPPPTKFFVAVSRTARNVFLHPNSVCLRVLSPTAAETRTALRVLELCKQTLNPDSASMERDVLIQNLADATTIGDSELQTALQHLIAYGFLTQRQQRSPGDGTLIQFHPANGGHRDRTLSFFIGSRSMASPKHAGEEGSLWRKLVMAIPINKGILKSDLFSENVSTATPISLIRTTFDKMLQQGIVVAHPLSGSNQTQIFLTTSLGSDRQFERLKSLRQNNFVEEGGEEGKKKKKNDENSSQQQDPQQGEADRAFQNNQSALFRRFVMMLLPDEPARVGKTQFLLQVKQQVPMWKHGWILHEFAKLLKVGHAAVIGGAKIEGQSMKKELCATAKGRKAFPLPANIGRVIDSIKNEIKNSHNQNQNEGENAVAVDNTVTKQVKIQEFRAFFINSLSLRPIPKKQLITSIVRHRKDWGSDWVYQQVAEMVKEGLLVEESSASPDQEVKISSTVAGRTAHPFGLGGVTLFTMMMMKSEGPEPTAILEGSIEHILIKEIHAVAAERRATSANGGRQVRTVTLEQFFLRVKSDCPKIGRVTFQRGFQHLISKSAVQLTHNNSAFDVCQSSSALRRISLVSRETASEILTSLRNLFANGNLLIEKHRLRKILADERDRRVAYSMRITSMLELFINVGILHQQRINSENPVLKRTGQVELLKLVRRYESPEKTVENAIPIFELTQKNNTMMMMMSNQQELQQQLQSNFFMSSSPDAAAAFSPQQQQLLLLQQQQQQQQQQQYPQQYQQQLQYQYQMLPHQSPSSSSPILLYPDTSAMMMNSSSSFINYNHQNNIMAIPNNNNNNTKNNNNHTTSSDLASSDQYLHLKSVIIASLRSTGSVSKFALIANVSRDTHVPLPAVRSVYATMLSEGIISEIDQQRPQQSSNHQSAGALVFTRLALRTVNREQLLIATTLMLSNCRMQKVTAIGELSQKNPKWDREEVKLAFRDLINESFVFEIQGEDGASYVMLAALKEQILAQQQQQGNNTNNNNNNNNTSYQHQHHNNADVPPSSSSQPLQPFHVANVNGPSPLQQLLHPASQQQQQRHPGNNATLSSSTASTLALIKSTKMGRDLRDDEAKFLAQVVKQLESHPDAARDGTTSQNEIPIRSFSAKLDELGLFAARAERTEIYHFLVRRHYLHESRRGTIRLATDFNAELEKAVAEQQNHNSNNNNNSQQNQSGRRRSRSSERKPSVTSTAALPIVNNNNTIVPQLQPQQQQQVPPVFYDAQGNPISLNPQMLMLLQLQQQMLQQQQPILNTTLSPSPHQGMFAPQQQIQQQQQFVRSTPIGFPPPMFIRDGQRLIRSNPERLLLAPPPIRFMNN